MSQVTWRLYYDDLSTFDSNDGEPEHAPPFGLIAVVGYDEAESRMMLHRWDYYYCKDLDGRPIWYGSDFMGVIDQFAHDINRDIHGLKMGRTIDNKTYQEIVSKASHDRDLSKKQAPDFRSKPRDTDGR